MVVFIGKVNSYMFRTKAAIFGLSQLQVCSNSANITRQYRHIYMTLFEQNCNCDNLKMASSGRNM